MSTQQDISRQELGLSGGKQIPFLEVPADISEVQILQSLTIQQPEALLMISGGQI